MTRPKESILTSYRENPNIDIDNEHFIYDDKIISLSALASELRYCKNSENVELKEYQHPHPMFDNLYSVGEIKWLPDHVFENKKLYNAVDAALRYLSEILHQPYVMCPQELSFESQPLFHFEVINAFKELLLLFDNFVEKHSIWSKNLKK